MKSRRDSPCAQSVKQDGGWIGRFIGVVFIEQLVTGMGGIGEFCQFLAEGSDLFVVENADATQIAVLVEESQLLVCQLKGIDICIQRRQETADRLVVERQIPNHGRSLLSNNY